MLLFAEFIRNVFGVSIEEFSRQMERAVVSKALLVRGRIDAVFGSLVFEFKVDLPRELDIARDELAKYLQSLLEEQPIRSYLGIATDGVAFRVYKPVISENIEVTDLREIDKIDLSREEDLENIYLWFDAYLFSTEKVPPTTSDLTRRFGAGSPTFAFVQDELRALLGYLREEPSVRVKMKNWARYLEIVYGNRLGNRELFARHTYLATLAKLLVYLRFSDGHLPSRSEAFDILSGKAFERFGIYNLADLDFFSWILLSRIRHRVTNLVMGLLRELAAYDLTKIDEDVFKELYQELVDPDIRHDLGEYYTPDWLADLLLEKEFEERLPESFLDPSCGSGTFLFLFLRKWIQRELKNGSSKHEILSHVQENVVGVDIHPLAVTISRMNYLLAIRDLLEAREGSVHIPVYMSDSLRVPETHSDVRYGVPIYRIPIENQQAFRIPHSLVHQPWVFDRIVDLMGSMGLRYEEEEVARSEVRRAFLAGLEDIWHFKESERQVLEEDFETLLTLIDERANTIWTFILRNIYRPVALRRRKFAMVAGNPPWLTMKQMKSSDYQSFLKDSYRLYGLLPEGTHLFPHLEEATLFFRRSADLYLEDGGTIGYVMPRSILVAQHHRPFLNFDNPKVRVKLLVDAEGVEPLFKVPACALLAEKGQRTSFPVTRLKLAGSLPQKNSSLDVALNTLAQTADEYWPPLLRKGGPRSPYHGRFTQGATIVPRSFWFVTVVRHPVMGVNPERPYVETDPSLQMKAPWSRIRMAGNVSRKHLFATLLGSELVPFAHLTFRVIVLPVEVRDATFQMLSSHEEVRTSGHPDSAEYFKKAEEAWREHRTERSSKHSIYEWLNYRKKITNQNPARRYRVLYTSSATHIVASFVDTNGIGIPIDGMTITPTAFVAESKTYSFETDDDREALYLCSNLNAPHRPLVCASLITSFT
jgi:SAM-dependent methyltransferase